MASNAIETAPLNGLTGWVLLWQTVDGAEAEEYPLDSDTAFEMLVDATNHNAWDLLDWTRRMRQGETLIGRGFTLRLRRAT